MKRTLTHTLKTRLTIVHILTAAAIALTATIAYAGGPLLVSGGQPIRWPAHRVAGGALNSETVDAGGTVLYRVDSGTLGPLSNQQATALVDHIFDLYNSVPTSTIRFRNAGPILDPDSGQPVDVTQTNAGKFIGRTPTFQNPIIFDSNGAITGGGGVLGFFGFESVDEPNLELHEGFVVLNGLVLTRNQFTTTSFLGVFTHEFGHFAGPLDHEQSNGNIASDGTGAVLPAGITTGQAFDLYVPFTETLYPFIFDAPADSQLRGDFPDSGYFVASLDLDTQNALSDLYPTAAYQANTGSIEGSVVVATDRANLNVDGINVVARRINLGAYPPAPGTLAFPSPPAKDGFGVPQSPPQQNATDSLATVSSSVTGLQFGNGKYRITGLPPGDYMVEIQQINPNALRGSGIGPLAIQAELPVPEEFFNGSGNSSNTVGTFLPVTVTAGQVTSGIDFRINGLSSSLAAIDEVEPNDMKKKAQKVGFPSEISGAVSVNDPGVLRVAIPDGSTAFIQDLYRITVTDSKIFYIFLNGTSGTATGDLDLYLFDADVSKKRTSLDDPHLVAVSGSPTSDEGVFVRLTPGIYYIGVSGFAGTETYKLRIVNSL